MSRPITPETMVQRLAELEQRVERLESVNVLVNSSLKDGAIRFYDSANVLRVYVGKLPNGLYGIRTYNAAGVQTNEVSG